MSITTFDLHVDAKFNRAESDIRQATVTNILPAAGGIYSLWQTALYGGATATSGSGNTCDNTTTGSIPLPTVPGGNTLYTDCCSVAATASLTAYVADRLVTTSGLDGTLNTAQAVNSVALPARAGTGEKCAIALEAYTATGGSTVTFTVSYTNQAGVAGRTGTVTGTLNQVGKMLFVQLQAGDTGVRSVQSVTQNVTSGGAGNYGVTIYKPLTWINPGSAAGSCAANSCYDTFAALLSSSMCLWVYVQHPTSTAITAMQISVGFVNG